MGALAGLLLGLGIVLVASSFRDRPERRTPTVPRPHTQRLRETLAQAGLGSITPARLVLACLGVGAVCGLLTVAFSQSWTIALAFAVFGGYAPWGLVKRRQAQRQADLRTAWPDVVDNLASAVRAGLSLPESLIQLGTRGPAPLREPFLRFGEDFRANGRFDHALDRLKADLADPVGDRVVESLRMARAVGGSDLGRLLRTLSSFLREDGRTRSELEARQSWTVNAARLAVAAPWLLLGLLALRPEAVAAYNSAAGLVLLAIGLGICVVAYRLMLRIGRLPTEERVLR